MGLFQLINTNRHQRPLGRREAAVRQTMRRLSADGLQSKSHAKRANLTEEIILSLQQPSPDAGLFSRHQTLN